MIAKIRKFYRERLLRRPTQVVLEPTNLCNLNCPYCMVGMQNKLVSKYGMASHSLMTRPQGVMNEEVFYVVLDNLKKFGIKKVYLRFQDEPFLNPLTSKFANIVKQNRFEVGTFTNGMTFNDSNIKEIMGNLLKNTLDGIWDSKHYREFRKKVDNAVMNLQDEPYICITYLRWK